ncbi:hypothetical protein JZ751_009470 [Albula glossodonta]|uniref:Rap-GAP domain-containing protein n=1 Tax=Albula glossodonta TaxID=121402 RepID=A0A8T2NZQ2_9TELE|nr:hypothetical protein JZ751_009470 [Albula glossodonta]
MERERKNDKLFSRKRSFTFGAYGGVDRFICSNETRRPESIEHSILDILDSPTNEAKSVLSTTTNQRTTDLFEIIEKLQLLKMSGTLPLVLPPKSGGYWIDPPFEKFVETSLDSSAPGLGKESYDIIERDSEAKIYREFFKYKAPELITAFDEHRVSQNFKFGVLYQKEGQRKRHIGNDIVALVYQEGPAPFISDIISSHFLHCFIVVRRVSVTAREDVPPFGPTLPDPPIFTERSSFRDFLLTKLINAEMSCYKAERFNRLELRTRSCLLEGLRSELSSQSQCMLGDQAPTNLSLSDGVRGGSDGGGGFIENFKASSGADKEGDSESTTKQSGPNTQLNDSPSSADAKGQGSPQEEE